MIKYSEDEIYTATQVVRHFSSILTKISKHKEQKLVIVKNNKFEAVLLNIQEYEKLQKAYELLMQIYQENKK